MLSYEVCDAIADSVIPVLAVAALLVPWVSRPFRPRVACLQNLLALGAVAIAYGEQAIDNAFHLWPRMGMDYSGHTALFAAVASSLWQQGIPWRWVSIIVGVAYAGLMLYQRYHTLADIVTTAAVVIPVLTAYWVAVRRAGNVIVPATPTG